MDVIVKCPKCNLSTTLTDEDELKKALAHKKTIHCSGCNEPIVSHKFLYTLTVEDCMGCDWDGDLILTKHLTYKFGDSD